MKTIYLIATAAVLIAGCSDNQQTGSTKAGATKPAAGVAQAFVTGTPFTGPDFAVAGAAIIVDPNPYSACAFPKGQAIVNVGFDAREAGAKHVQILVQGTHSKPQLWGQAPGVLATHPTGKWITDGVKFLLLDMTTQKLIAVTTVHATPCP